MRRRQPSFRLAWAGVASALLAACLAASPALRASASAPAGGWEQVQEEQKPAKKSPAARLAEPWPDAAKMEADRVESEKRALFASTDPLPITLSADFGAINKDRVPDSTRRFPGTLEFPGEDGRPASIAVQLSSRGHLRLNPRTCGMVPIRVEMVKKDVKGTVFDGHKELKLVTHCQNDSEYEQNVLAEYLAYRAINAVTADSFRARLVKSTYVDSQKRRTIATRYAMFIEDDDDVARRMEGRVVPLPNQLFRQVDQDSVVRMALHQFMIGNTDYSIIVLHNVRLIQRKVGLFRTVSYDFDVSGLVNARYAIPARVLGIKSVRDRLYRGPCLSVEELEPWLAEFRAKQAAVMAEVDAVPGLDRARREDVREYLEDFFSIVNERGRTKRLLVDRCPRVAGM